MTMKGRKHSPETIAKMRESGKRRAREKPHTMPDPTGNTNFLGKTHTPEARARISAAMKGNKRSGVGAEHHNWKGDLVGYAALHDWITRYYGQPIGCEECRTNDPEKRYEWSNVSGEYRRDRTDFRRLCKKCHNDYDGVNVWQQTTG